MNIGNPDEMTVRELADVVLELTGSRSRIEVRPLPQDDPQVRRPMIDRAREVLGWEPRVSLREGLGKTIEYFQQLEAAEHAPSGSGPEAGRVEKSGTA
jgi:UDP-glucuronate decarboxylase